MWQTTIEKSVSCAGVGLHSGKKVALGFHPASAGSGVTFAVQGPEGTSFLGPDPRLVAETRFATSLAQGEVKLGTIEHVLAAVRGLEIDNLIIEVQGDEVPIMDGSAASFVFLLRQAGLREQRTKRKVLRLVKECGVQGDGRWIRAYPFSGFKVKYTIDFPHPLLGKQSLEYEGNTKNFVQLLSRARTFGFLHDVEKLQSQGLILGGSLENALVLDECAALNPEGLRFPDEPVRHKLLDFIGDLGLMAYPVQGAFEVHCSGHELNNRFVCQLEQEKEHCLQLIEQSQDAVYEPQGDLAWQMLASNPGA
jgi:UDP-3-O-[3-hydroxymyristoyl] N-acetylglucosamine deacetylase